MTLHYFLLLKIVDSGDFNTYTFETLKIGICSGIKKKENGVFEIKVALRDSAAYWDN